MRVISPSLKTSCAQYAEKYHYDPSQFARGLEAYAVHLFAQEEGFDAVLDGAPASEVDLSERILRAHDLGIDGVLEDESGKRLLLIQVAWRAKGIEEDKVGHFFDVPSRILNEGYLAEGGDQIQELLSGIGDKIADGYEVLARFVTNVPIGENTRLANLVEAKNAAYEEAGLSVFCEIYGPSEIDRRATELENAVNGGFVDEVSLRFEEGSFFELKQPYRTLIGAIKANELVDLYRRKGVGNSLFNLNIRLPLTSRRVNPGMVKTAASEDEGSHFLYYNNGVSAVCSEFELANGNQVRAKRFQIINGAQTVSALVKARSQVANSDVRVLFRLTATSEQYGGPFTENVIRYNNTQNPVKVSDFFSNDPIQEWLRDNLAKQSGRGAVPNIYYVHKSGYKPKGATGKALKIEQLAGIRHAFLYGPIASYREPARFFEREGLYAEAFGIDGAIVYAWTQEVLAQACAAIAINDRIQQLARQLKQDDATKSGEEAKYLYRLSRYVTALVGAGLEQERATTFNDYATLIASKATFDKYVDPLTRAARRAVLTEWNARRANSRAVQLEYNLARDEETWLRLKATLKEQVAADLL